MQYYNGGHFNLDVSDLLWNSALRTRSAALIPPGSSNFKMTWSADQVARSSDGRCTETLLVGLEWMHFIWTLANPLQFGSLFKPT